MANGGGPACLRLRVVLTEEELACIHQGILFTDTLYLQLKNWIENIIEIAFIQAILPIRTC